jgi:ketosteroid isomerase-like protein
MKMRCLFLLSACAAMAALTACSHPTIAANDEAGVRQWISDYTHAFEARDTNAVMELYTPDVVAYDMLPPLEYAGRDAYTKNYAAFFAGFKGPLGVECRDLHIQVSGDLAIFECLTHLTGTTNDGQPLDVWVRNTSGLRKVNGHWLDFHDHVSLPVDMVSGKAAMDLKPQPVVPAGNALMPDGRRMSPEGQ